MSDSKKPMVLDDKRNDKEVGLSPELTMENTNNLRHDNANRRSPLKAISIAIAAAVVGGIIGYSVKPVASIDDMIVIEDVSGPIGGGNTSADTDIESVTYKPYTQITSIMDNARHVIEERYFATDGSIVACEDGYAIMRKKYDKNGKLVSTAYFDTADRPYLVEKLGYSSISMVYDDAGNKVSETYYDTRGEVISLDKKNYAGVQYTYDENKNITSEEFFDTDGNPILCDRGYHKGQYTWDDKKHKLTERYYDTEDNLVVMKSGYAGVDHQYDDDGNDKKCIYYDVNGEIGANSDGTIIVKRTYNFDSFTHKV